MIKKEKDFWKLGSEEGGIYVLSELFERVSDFEGRMN